MAASTHSTGARRRALWSSRAASTAVSTRSGMTARSTTGAPCSPGSRPTASSTRGSRTRTDPPRPRSKCVLRPRGTAHGSSSSIEAGSASAATPRSVRKLRQGLGDRAGRVRRRGSRDVGAGSIRPAHALRTGYAGELRRSDFARVPAVLEALRLQTDLARQHSSRGSRQTLPRTRPLGCFVQW